MLPKLAPPFAECDHEALDKFCQSTDVAPLSILGLNIPVRQPQPPPLRPPLLQPPRRPLRRPFSPPMLNIPVPPPITTISVTTSVATAVTITALTPATEQKAPDSLPTTILSSAMRTLS
ncbi:hypothetical protein SprV_0702402800 [Sparganum proliferum]